MADGPLAAVLFDMDGTLVDSERIWTVALRELAASYGGELSETARAAMIGAGADDTMALLHADLGQPERDAAFGAAWLDERVKELFADGLEWLPGARELVSAVRTAGLRTALVTNTARMMTEIAMGTLGAENFDVIICGDEVPRPKPDPAPYALAAAALGLAPAHCVAIEDSPAGLRSAIAAGCVAVGVVNLVPLDPRGAVILPSLIGVDVGRLRALVPNCVE